MNATGTDLVYSTYLGGSDTDGRGSNDPGGDLAIDSTGNVYLTGTTESENFPTTPGAFRPAYPGGFRSGFVTKLNASGSALVYSSYLGGRSDDRAYGIAVDSAGSAYVAGSTASDDFPITPDALQPPCPIPAPFVTKINPPGNALFYSTCLEGSSRSDEALAVAVDPFGSAYVTGLTRSTDFPTTAGAPQPAAGGLDDSYVVKLDSVTTVSAASFTGPRTTAGAIVSGFGPNLATDIAVAVSLPLPTQLLGTIVTVTDSLDIDRPSPLFFVSPSQINFQIPKDTEPGPAKITVTSGDGTVVNGSVQIEAAAPALFSANASGRDVAAGRVVRVAADGSQTSASLTRFDTAEGRHLPEPVAPVAAGEDVILVLFGSGISGFSSSVTATIAGQAVDVLFAGPQGQFEGLDQVNLRLPGNLAGGSVNIELTVDGKSANVVSVTIVGPIT
ncbi:MAG: SBBP repeat-containing protein [Acidobacteria bacterium]|nr:SBBP repeat-containing protein [Acidobacteriota bacterium]